MYSFTLRSSLSRTYTALYELFAKFNAIFLASILSVLTTLFFVDNGIVVGAKISQSVSNAFNALYKENPRILLHICI